MEPSTRWVLLLLVLPWAAPAQASGDSLQTALDAITRRQRDLSLPARPSGYYALSQYRHKGGPAAPDDDDAIAFLDTARDFAGDGQPENIGYGYQKTVSPGPAGYPAQLLDVPVHSSPTMFGNVLVDYVRDGEPQPNYYPRGIEVDAKRSLFRERGNDAGEQDIAYRSVVPGQYVEEDKQGNILIPSLFRERFHSNTNGDSAVDMEKLRHYATEAMAKQIEAEQEEQRLENKRNDYGASRQEDEYLNLLQNLWEKYKQTKPQIVSADGFTENDVEDMISSLRSERPSDHISSKRQYAYGSGFDLFNNGGLMGGWGNGGFSKRNKQRVDGAGQQGGNFLYSLKYVSPEANREAVETLTDGGGIEIPDERDEDILRLASGFNTNGRGEWVYPQPRPASLDDFYGASEDPFETLRLENQMAEPRSALRSHLTSFGRADNEYRDISPGELMMIPERNGEKRYIYEAKKKRYPVTKRSSNFYASPPMLHHKALDSEDIKDSNKKKSTMNGVTDPKVAQELNQIFSSSVTQDKDLKDNAHKSDAETNPKMTTSDERKELTHETTIAPTVPTVKATVSAQNAGKESTENLQKNKTSEERKKDETHTHGASVHVGKETVEPITMSKIQTPLEIKKKSIDWSDYFGIDKRRKKTAPENSDLKAGDGNMVDDNWLLNQYYRTLAMVSNPLKKRLSLHTHGNSPADGDKREHGGPQAYHTEIFSRSAQREANKRNLNDKEDSGIDNMDSKLRNMEDLIVNEAVKYTGSHQGAEDPKEIQEMKDKIMSRLAAAYSLEKMRLALAEFKSSLQAQMMSKYNPENQKSSLRGRDIQDENKMKRVAVKKEKAEDDKNTEENDDKKKKRNDGKKSDGDETSGEFLGDPVDVEPMSEGYMGRSLDGYETGCPVLDQVLQRCRRVSRMSEDLNEVFVPLCSLHQICNICGPEVGAPSASACDLMFATEADSMCEDDIKCRRSSHRIMTLLRRSQAVNIGGISPEHCSNDSCLAQYFLTSPLPSNQPR